MKEPNILDILGSSKQAKVDMERKKYSAEEKAAHVGRCLRGEITVANLAREAGISRPLLTKWLAKARQGTPEEVFKGPGKPRSSSYSINKYRRMMVDLRKENEALRRENEALKGRTN